MEQRHLRIEIASDVNHRDGIGIEVYRNEELVLEIFRDDTKRTRKITIHKDNVTLELMEESIKRFKEEISWDFINDSE